jgi:hypothetical protein
MPRRKLLNILCRRLRGLLSRKIPRLNTNFIKHWRPTSKILKKSKIVVQKVTSYNSVLKISLMKADVPKNLKPLIYKWFPRFINDKDIHQRLSEAGRAYVIPLLCHIDRQDIYYSFEDYLCNTVSSRIEVASLVY